MTAITSHLDKNKVNKSVALGLSGGVDSAVSAYLLKQQGYDVTAIYIQCWSMPGCRAEQDRQDALKIALQLGIPFQVLDFKQQYQQGVMDYFVTEYRAGRTPNPDVLCNQVIKFGLFYQWAQKNKFDYLATGHYAQTGSIKLANTNTPVLLSSQDLHKDQTYFLHQLTQAQLPHILFPIGHLLKKEVRQLAQENKLHVANKKDSVGICFVGEINVHNFLKEQLGEKNGDIITADGQKIGNHNGIWFYTIGQRHGFDLDMKLVKQHTHWLDQQGNIPPLYVIKRNPKQNQLIIGLEPETMADQFELSQLHLINPNFDLNHHQLKVRIRHTGKLVACQLLQDQQSKIVVTTQEPLQGLAEGQFAVFYFANPNNKQKTQAEYVCIGGGVIA